MIGTHDSFTYLNTGNIFIDIFNMFWRCQVKTLDEQYELGVRVFDIRVIAVEKDGIVCWEVGHGIARVRQYFVNLEDICVYFKKNYPGSFVRIMLEKNGNDLGIRASFEKEAIEAIQKYADMIWTIYVKNPWICMYSNKKFKEVKDTCCHLFNWHIDKDLLTNIKNFEFSSGSIKGWAKKHNPSKITKEMIDDPNILYFMDYVGVYPYIK